MKPPRKEAPYPLCRSLVGGFLFAICFLFAPPVHAVTLTNPSQILLSTSSLTAGADSRYYACAPFMGCFDFAISGGIISDNPRFYLNQSGTISHVSGSLVRVTGTPASNEPVCVSISVNASASLYEISCDFDFSSAVGTTQTFDGAVDVPIDAGDYISLVITTPAWATNPTGTLLFGASALFEGEGSTIEPTPVDGLSEDAQMFFFVLLFFGALLFGYAGYKLVRISSS